MVVSTSVGLQLCGFFVFFVFLYILQDNLSFKSRNALFLNTERVRLISFVTINLLGGFLWLFLS